MIMRVVKHIHVLLLALIVVAYLVIASFYARRTPAWQVPDEPAHVNYIWQIAVEGNLPVMAVGGWDNEYLERIKAAKFAPSAVGDQFATIQYENWQPPLYYLLAAPVYRFTNNGLMAVRLFSVLLGALTIVVAWLTIRLAFPAQGWLADGVAAFIAFLPQHLAIMAGVSNDSLAELVAALILLGCVAYLQGEIPVWLLGVLMGIGLWTKGTVYPFAAVIALTVLLRARRETWGMRRLVRTEVLFVAVALLIGGWWWLRNIATYGGFDFLAQAIHDKVVIGQPLTSDYLAAKGLGGWLGDGARITFQSFWGQFGWMGVLLPESTYAILLVISVLLACGGWLAFVRWRRALSTTQRDVLYVFATALFFVTAAYAYYNLKYVQFQGRYLFPTLIPIALGAVAGVAGWGSLLRGLKRPLTARVVTNAALALGALLMAGYSLYALFRIIVPALAR